jgi:hypothetical protein
MCTATKYFIIFCSLAFIAFQVNLIVRDYSDSRIITVVKDVPKVQLTELKAYQITSYAHFEQANVIVQPVTFSDKLLLTSDQGNLVSILLKIIASLLFAWYIFKLTANNLFSGRRYLNAVFVMILLLFSALMVSAGLKHTIEFWKNTYEKDIISNAGRHSFTVLDNSDTMLYIIVLWIVPLFYRYFGSYYSKIKDAMPAV